MPQIDMFTGNVTNATTGADSVNIYPVADGRLTLAAYGTGLEYDGGKLAIEVSYDEGDHWQAVVDQDGNAAEIDAANRQCQIQVDGGRLRVVPSGGGGSMLIPQVVVAGQVAKV